AGSQVVEVYGPWISTLESINLAPLSSSFQNPQIVDFGVQKQKLYDQVSELILACQAVAGPLGDEWAEMRGDSLEDRINHVRSVSKDLETCTSQLKYSLQLLSEMVSQQESTPATEGHYKADGGSSFEHHLRSSFRGFQRPLMLADMDQSKPFSEGLDPAVDIQRNIENSKVKRFFGEVPAQAMPLREAEEVPEYLRHDYEGEIVYDMKSHPRQLRGGTLNGLVEQLTRHDRLDSPFNNTFLLTYRSFTTAPELFEYLVKRWNIQPPSGLAREDLQTWVDKKQKPIRFRVVNILKSWFDNYWMEGNDEASQELMQK
ncbi:cell division cycle- protein, partial [Cryomyces antarcticus]